MQRLALLALALSPMLLAAASATVVPPGQTADAALDQARTEARQAADRLAALEKQAANAENEAEKLRAEQAAALAAIEESEARISESGAALRLVRARVALGEQRLAKRRAPLASLLAGLAMMGRQPPLLSLADGSSLDEMVRVRALLDATMPVIEQRSAALSSELAGQRRLASAAEEANAKLARDREELVNRQTRFAELEKSAAIRAARLQGEALGAGDRVLSSGEALELEGSEAGERRAARAAAAELIRLDMAPPRPMPPESQVQRRPLAYRLPVEASLIEGLGSINRAGIASRGLKFATARGASVVAPADGTILFAAPYRGQNGLVIIDHGGGWTSLLLGVASEMERGEKVRSGQPIGRALGPVGVELRQRGVPVSPAFIAASSVPLSNGGNDR